MIYKVYIDFETRSELDLTETNAYEYAVHPSTDVLCMSFYVTKDGEPCGSGTFDLFELITDKDKIVFLFKGTLIYAHGAFFERNIWLYQMVKKYGYPNIPTERWRCTMAKAYYNNAGGSLDKTAKILDLSIQKDSDGKSAMMRMSKPKKPSKKDPSIWESRQKYWLRLLDYCMQDVIVEKLIDDFLPDLSADEQIVWELDQKINDRGYCIDHELATKLKDLVDWYAPMLNEQVRILTNNKVGKATERDQLLAYLKSQGLEINDLQSATITSFLLQNNNIPENCRKLLEVRKLASKTSVTKLDKMLSYSQHDGRARGTLQYHGASTGRWAGRGIQPHNFPRPDRELKKKNKNFIEESIVRVLAEDDSLKSDFNLPKIISSCIRSVIIPSPGKLLYVADYSAIEARVLAWLAKDEEKLNIFRTGKCIYCEMASSIYGKTITEEEHPFERSVGKVGELALGYQGGIGAYGEMSISYEVDLAKTAELITPTITPYERQIAEWIYENFYLLKTENPLKKEIAIACDVIKQRWRIKNEKIVDMWEEVRLKTIDAIQFPGKKVYINNFMFFKDENFLKITLPSGREIKYFKPYLKSVKGKLAIFYVGYKENRTTPMHIGTYGGKIVENITQAVARDIMTVSMVYCEQVGYEVLFTVHDEIICEHGNGNVAHFENIMLEPLGQIPWLSGCPVAVDAKQLRRYKK